jgi:glyceraldehyde-3-phosphate dehydrogenase/erythrose-4-phosphate dehydrogenase
MLPKLTLDGLAVRVPWTEAEVAMLAVDIKSANVNTRVRRRVRPGGDDIPQF